MQSFREEEKTKHTITFSHGEKNKDEKVSLKKSDKQHGSIISFRSSKKYLGDSTRMPIEEVKDWFDRMFYFQPKKVKGTITIYDGLKLVEETKYKAKPFYELLDRLSDDKKAPKCILSGDASFTENTRTITGFDEKGNAIVKPVKKKKGVHVDVAFKYDGRYDEPIYDSYCNTTNTLKGGTHQSTVEECICRYLISKTNEQSTDKQKEKYPLKWDDVREGLCCVINLSTDAQVGFVGNEKNEIDNKQLVPYISEIVNKGLNDYFKENPNELKTMCNIVRLNAKARVEAAKVKSLTNGEKLDIFKQYDMKNYIPCNNHGKNDFRELFIVEGNSASGSFRNGCFPDSQAAYLVRGNTLNVFKADIEKLDKNEELKGLIRVMRCGIGKSFDINKLYFDRINLFTDADSDGHYISSGLLAFFYMYYPEIIKAGRLYRVFTPLYEILSEDGKGSEFVANKSAMVNKYRKKIHKNYSIWIDGSKEKADADEIAEFLEDIFDYQEQLISISNNAGHSNKFLIEDAIATLTILGYIDNPKTFDLKIFNDQKVIKDLMSHIQEKFPEIKMISPGVLYGPINGSLSNVKISAGFIKKCAYIIDVYKKYGYLLKIQSKNASEPRVCTIGEFLDEVQKFVPKIIRRFKGLGELNGKDLKRTALDINNRVSVRYTLDDAEKELETFNKLFNDSLKDRRARHQMMRDYTINKLDLDN